MVERVAAVIRRTLAATRASRQVRYPEVCGLIEREGGRLRELCVEGSEIDGTQVEVAGRQFADAVVSSVGYENVAHGVRCNCKGNEELCSGRSKIDCTVVVAGGQLGYAVSSAPPLTIHTLPGPSSATQTGKSNLALAGAKSSASSHPSGADARLG